jgi:hypothetical protein
MKVLFDECVPRPMRMALTGHAISTIDETGWKGLKNGVLLGRAEGCYDAFVTADKNLRYQQNLADRRIAILERGTPRWPVLRRYIPQIQQALDGLQPGEYHTLNIFNP